MSEPKATYISSSGELTTPPLQTRVYTTLSNYATIAYLFVETLVAPIVSPNAPGPGENEPPARAAARTGGGGFGGGGGGGGSGRRGGGGRGNPGFMDMNDLRGGNTVDSCRSGC
ncbi:hypothetical protein CspeluHIS016_0307390 [Cutaneotrichosporon spelunceum]|uniref:Uncharacterized protein n=1 Tax=Cutaneotrichosporon spelunceum TaxID=1672016 RepID=A0AAD3TUR2_9TREE|nr:hypothetical protein CspeluHIS016_0307390 [Cutaneotrichosporon spelunceum]